MSTRATVWIINEKSGDECFLYHHCDGYMLDEELDPILKELEPEEWTVDSVTKAITDFDDAYREVSYGVGWDSEYLYKISVDKMKMEKFECGISDTINGDRKEEKSDQKYLAKEYTYSEQRTKAVNNGPDAERRGYLMGLASFLRNMHEKTLKSDFNLSDYEVNLVLEYMGQTPPNGKE